MDETEYTEICDFLRGDELHKLWPDSVTSSKASKRNFRRKCASFELLNGTLHYRHKKYGAIRVIRQSEKDSILYACHKTPTAGHFGINKTDRTITERYYWPAHYKDVEEYIGSCDECQRSSRLQKVPSVLHPVPVPDGSFVQFGMDLVGPFKETKEGNKYIVVLTDYLTKWPEAEAIPNKSATTIARFIIKVICRYSSIEVLITDQGREFCNKLNDEICRMIGIDHRRTSAYHPQTNGLTERYNQTLVHTLVKYTNEEQDNWDEFIEPALLAYRSAPQKSTGETPFFLAFGKKPRLLVEDIFPTGPNANRPDNEDLDQSLAARVEASVHMKEIHANAKEKIADAQKLHKKYYDKKHAAPSYALGDMVLIDNSRRNNRKGDKLLPKWTGPFEIEEIREKGTYRLKAKKTLVNATRMKPYKRPLASTTSVPPPASTTSVPPPASTTSVPPPASTTFVPPPASTTSVPPPASTTSVPPPASTTSVPPPASTTSVPPRVPPPARSSCVPRLKAKKTLGLKAKKPLVNGTRIKPYKRPTLSKTKTCVPPPASTTSVPPPASTTSVPPPASTTSVPPPASTTSVPPPASTTSVPPPASTTSVPPRVPPPARSSCVPRLKAKKTLGLKAKKISVNGTRIKPYKRPTVSKTKTCVPPPASMSCASPPSCTFIKVDRPTNFLYNPVGSEWQKERAAAVGLKVKKPIPNAAPCEKSVDTTPGDNVKIRGDGNCYFRTLSHILTGTQSEHDILRLNVHTYTREHNDMFSDVASNDSYCDTSNMDSPGEWATDIELLATASMIATDICVYTPTQRTADREYRWITYRPIENVLPLPGLQHSEQCIYISNRSDHFVPVYKL